MSATPETFSQRNNSITNEGDYLGHSRHAGLTNGLHSEAIHHLSSPSTGARIASEQSPGGKFELNNGDYWVKKGDNLYKIAQKSLASHGNEHPDGRSVFAEIDRIVEANLKYYPKLKDHRLEPGMILTVEDKNAATRPELLNESKQSVTATKVETEKTDTCTDQTWKIAEPGTISSAQKCDLVFAGSDTKVVVHPGGQAILQRGSSGFVFKGGQATVMDGATVIDAGGAIELQPGARFIDLQAISKQAQERAQAEMQTQAAAKNQPQQEISPQS